MTKDTMTYTKGQHDKDESNFTKSEKEGVPINWSTFQRLMIHDLCCNTEVIDTTKLGIYSIEQIQQALEFPNINSDVLLGTSEFLMRTSPHYNRLNTYYSNMALFDWQIDVYDVNEEKFESSKLKAAYFNICSQFEKMNIKHELSKIMKVLPCQDIFYGVICEDGNDFFIQRLDSSICKIQKIQDGLYNFKINLSAVNPLKIGAYPEYVQRAYMDFKNGTSNCMWYMPPADLQCCFKLNEHLLYPYPMLINIVKDIFDLDLYKKLKLQAARTDNYKALLIEVPIDQTTVDKPLLTPDTLGVFASMNKESMSNDIALLHTLGKAQAVSFKDNNNTRNNVDDATSDLHNSAGVSKEMFNGSASGTALSNSIENDSSVIYGFYRQVEIWFNRFIKIRKYNKPNFKFGITINDSTVYNRDKVIDRYLKQAQSGAPVRRNLMSLLGVTPSKANGALILENKVLEWQNLWIPLSSSFTQTGDGGRPTNESQGENLDTAGEQTANNDSNNKR